MTQAEILINLDAVTANVAQLRAGTTAEVMAVVKADGYGHGMVRSARAALRGGATWLGACTLREGLALRDAGLAAPVLSWLLSPGEPLSEGIARDIDLSVASPGLLSEVTRAAQDVGRPAGIHLKIDTGLTRSGCPWAGWPALVDAAAKAQADGLVDVVGVWSHFACADLPGHPSVNRQLELFGQALTVVDQAGLTPRVRHIANSAALLTRPDAHFDLVRPGIAIYGLSPVPGTEVGAGLRPAMTVRAPVMLAKRVPAGAGVSYGHTYHTRRETTVAVVPLGYADGIPRAASNRGPVALGGRIRQIAGRVCMDQVVIDCGDDDVAAGDLAVLFGDGDGVPSVDDWAHACRTINYEIVTRMGGSRIPRRYVSCDPTLLEPPGAAS